MAAPPARRHRRRPPRWRHRSGPLPGPDRADRARPPVPHLPGVLPGRQAPLPPGHDAAIRAPRHGRGRAQRVRAGHGDRRLRDRSRCSGGGAPRARPAGAGRRHRRGVAAPALRDRRPPFRRLPGDHPSPQEPPLPARPVDRAVERPGPRRGPARRARPRRRRRHPADRRRRSRGSRDPPRSGARRGPGRAGRRRRRPRLPVASTRASARPCSRRWRWARPSCAATGPRCPRWPATPPSSCPWIGTPGPGRSTRSRPATTSWSRRDSAAPASSPRAPRERDSPPRTTWPRRGRTGSR